MQAAAGHDHMLAVRKMVQSSYDFKALATTELKLREQALEDFRAGTMM